MVRRGQAVKLPDGRVVRYAHEERGRAWVVGADSGVTYAVSVNPATLVPIPTQVSFDEVDIVRIHE